MGHAALGGSGIGLVQKSLSKSKFATTTAATPMPSPPWQYYPEGGKYPKAPSAPLPLAARASCSSALASVFHFPYCADTPGINAAAVSLASFDVGDAFLAAAATDGSKLPRLAPCKDAITDAMSSTEG
eukprot:CAMPEP_0171947278 /NCGR_PEP_ID=MMETSP0993-20121228/60875_1 /TAXON_ID=483369 /ORGANISM="non described non described, Strain CCMP2098" /LENGTH=127 /DNA_ID=CAMNT_0012591003 /DNA_START=15 /DNA_END=396 /DNA_ORIENTATION=-